MSSIVASIKDLIASIFEVITFITNKAFGTASDLVHAFVNFFVGTIRMALHTVGSTLEAAGGVGKFIASQFSSIPLVSMS